MIEVNRKLVRRAGQIFPVREVEFVREGATLATLVEGDPLLQTLDMPIADIERLRAVYAPAITSRPLVRAAFDVILEYRREQTDDVTNPRLALRRNRRTP